MNKKQVIVDKNNRLESPRAYFLIGVVCLLALISLNFASAAVSVNVTSPNTTFNYLRIGGLTDLNYTLTSSSPLFSCWYSHNGINTTLISADQKLDNSSSEVTTSGFAETSKTINLAANSNVKNVTLEIKNSASNHYAYVVFYYNDSTNYTTPTQTATINDGVYRQRNFTNPNVSITVDRVVAYVGTTAVPNPSYMRNVNVYGYINNYCLNNTAIRANFTLGNTNNLTFYANDTLGNVGSKTVTWSYKILENSQTYNLNTIEGATESFQINLTVATGYRISTGYLNYDGTDYAASISISGYNYLLRSITIPDISVAANKSFFWKINLDDATAINTNSFNQTVGNLGIDNCASYTIPLFNISLYDEETQSLLSASENTSIKVSLTLQNLGSTTNLLNYSTQYSNTNPARLCLQAGLGSSIYRLDGVIEYSSNGRFTEFYNFQNYTLSNTTSNISIYLYNLNSSVGQEFKITYKDSNFVPVDGALLNIQRKYVNEGLFKTTEIPKTGTEGYTVAHLVRNDVIYNIIVYKEGQVLATFENIIAECQNPLIKSCEVNLNSYGSSSLPTDFRTANDISFTLTYDRDTKIVSSIYTILSGATESVSLNVTLFDRLGNTSVCSDILLSSGGQLSCTIPSSFGNSTVVAVLYKDGEPIGQTIISLAVDPKDIYGQSIIVIAMLFFLLFIGYGASSDNPMIMGLSLIMGSIVLVALNLVYSPSFIGVGATILWFIISVVIILIKGSNRQ